MKKQLCTLAVISTLSASAFSNEMMVNYVKNNTTRTGVRASLQSGAGNLQITSLSSGNEKVKITSQSFEIGYQKIVPGKAGYSVVLNSTRINFDELDTHFTNLMVEGNATYGFANKAYIYGGGNLSRYKSPEIDLEEAFGTGFGLQFAGGYQINHNIAVELKSVSTAHTAKVYNGDDKIGDMVLSVGITKLGLVINF